MTTPAPDRHVCWSYDDLDDFLAVARRFLGAGLAAGEQIWFASGHRPPAMMAWLAEVTPAGNPDAVRFVPVAEAYPAGHVVDPAAQVATYRAATEQALADGFTGLRVVADGTTLVLSPEQLDAFTSYEHQIDRYLAGAPMSAICGYHRAVLPPASVHALACLHPETNAEVLFRLHADPAAPAGTVLAGELDLSCAELFPYVWGQAGPQPAGGEIRVRADDLRFVDHRALGYLQDYAEAHATTVVLQTGFGAAGRLAALLELDRVRVQVSR